MINRRNIRLVISLIVVALVGLIGIQIIWIRSAVQLERQRFESTVSQALLNVAEMLEKQEVASNVRKRFDVSRQGKTFFMGIDSLIRKSINRNDTTTSGLVFWNEISPGELQTEFHQISKDGTIDVIEETRQDSVGNVTYRKIRKARQTSNAPLMSDVSTQVSKGSSKQLERLMRKTGLVSDIFKELYNLNLNTGVEDRVNPHMVDSLLKMELKAVGIETPYVFGLYDFLNNKLFVDNPTDYIYDLMRTRFRVRLFPNDIFYHPDYLMVYFPEQHTYMFNNLWLMFSASGFFILIIIGTFFYTINTVIRQKKLSDIKTDFINNMTHELKTPISTISLACEALNDPDINKTTDMTRKYSRMISEENKRLSVLVENVLQSALLDKSDFDLNPEPVDVHKVIPDVIASMQMHLDKKKAVIKTGLNARDSIIETDRIHFRQVLNNLLDNAIKYTPELPEIVISTRNQNGNILISVSDNGIGISKDQQKLIFEKLYRVPTGNIHNVKGFGLGLSYVKAIVEKQGGSIKLESVPDEGSTFTISLPLKRS